MGKTSLQKINAFAKICLFVIFFPTNVNGLEKTGDIGSRMGKPTTKAWIPRVHRVKRRKSGFSKIDSADHWPECWKDSDCSDKNIYCLDGYCDGHCVPCQNFKREESTSGCAKKLEFCGPCSHGTEADDLTGGRKSERCETIGGLVNSSSTETPDVNQWSTWVLMALEAAVVSVLAATSFVYLYRKIMHSSTSNRRQNSKSTALTFNDSKKVIEPVELFNPPYNPDWNSMSGNLETAQVNHLGAQPFGVPYSVAEEESDSNRLLQPHETVNNNAVSEGYQEVAVELSKLRSEVSCVNNQGSSENETRRLPIPVKSASYDKLHQSSINIDSDDEIHGGSVGFSLFFKSFLSTNSSTSQTSQQPCN